MRAHIVRPPPPHHPPHHRPSSRHLAGMGEHRSQGRGDRGQGQGHGPDLGDRAGSVQDGRACASARALARVPVRLGACCRQILILVPLASRRMLVNSVPVRLERKGSECRSRVACCVRSAGPVPRMAGCIPGPRSSAAPLRGPLVSTPAMRLDRIAAVEDTVAPTPPHPLVTKNTCDVWGCF